MSTTVTYKGSTLTTVNNSTRTLKTAGKYMEGDVILVDVTESGSGSGVVWQDGQGYIHLSDEGDIELQTKTVTPTETAQTITADAGYYALEKVNVGAISNTYVGTGITRRSSTDLTASGATVTVPSGYYSAQASKVVASGTAGTPTATKGTVSNHSITVTPSVTNTTGYITGGTKNGTAVTVSASELVSGTKSITENGTGIDVTNYANVDVAIQKKYYATITSTGNYNYAYVKHPSSSGTEYYTAGDSFEIQENDEIYLYGDSTRAGVIIHINDEIVVDDSVPPATYTYIVPSATDVEISLTYGNPTQIYLTEIKSELSITQNGSYDVSDYDWANVNVSGGGGLVYETGTWTPSEDVASYVIPFANTHTTAPFYYTISDATGTYSSDLASTNYGVIYVCWNQIFGAPMYSTSSQIWYGRSNYLYRGTSATAAISAGVSSFTHSEYETGTSDLYPTYWATETGIKAYTNSSSRYWRSGRTYKWIAVWKPTT